MNIISDILFDNNIVNKFMSYNCLIDFKYYYKTKYKFKIF